MQFIGNDSPVSNSRLIFPSFSLGWIPTATIDAIINTFSFQKLGQFEDNAIPEVVCGFSNKNGISTALELFFSAEYRITIIQMRSYPIPGFSADFALRLFDWIKVKKFSDIFILSSADAFSRNHHQVESPFVGGKRFLNSPSLPKNLLDLLSEKHWTELEQWKEKNTLVGGTGNLWVLLGASFGLSRQQLFEIRKSRDEPASSSSSSSSSTSSSSSSSTSSSSSSSSSSGGTAILTITATPSTFGDSPPNIFTFLTLLPAANIPLPVCVLFFFGSDSPHHTANSARAFAEEVCELFGLVRRSKQITTLIGEGSGVGIGGGGRGGGGEVKEEEGGEKKKKKKKKKHGVADAGDDWDGLEEWGPRKIWNTQHELY